MTPIVRQQLLDIQREVDVLDAKLEPLNHMKRELADSIEISSTEEWESEDEYNDTASLLCALDEIEENVDFLKTELSQLI